MSLVEDIKKNSDQTTEINMKRTQKDKVNLTRINVIHKFNGNLDMQQAVEQIVLYRLKQKNLIN